MIAEALKFVGALIAASSAVAAAYLDGTRSVSSGRLTKKGRILVSAALLGVVLSGGAQVAQIYNGLESAEAVRLRHEETAVRLERVTSAVLKGAYPLEPLELLYKFEVEMDKLRPYTDRIQADLVAWLRTERGGRGETSDSLKNEPMIRISAKEEWMPRKNGPEASAHLVMFFDLMEFSFIDTTGVGKKPEERPQCGLGPVKRDRRFVLASCCVGERS